VLLLLEHEISFVAKLRLADRINVLQLATVPGLGRRHVSFVRSPTPIKDAHLFVLDGMPSRSKNTITAHLN